jgi:hypothetical protein
MGRDVVERIDERLAQPHSIYRDLLRAAKAEILRLRKVQMDLLKEKR